MDELGLNALLQEYLADLRKTPLLVISYSGAFEEAPFTHEIVLATQNYHCRAVTLLAGFSVPRLSWRDETPCSRAR